MTRDIRAASEADLQRKASMLAALHQGSEESDASRSALAADGAAAAAERYQTLVEQMPMMVYVAEWSEAAPFLYVSPQVEGLLGLKPDQLLSDDSLWYERLHPDDRERVLAEERRTFLAGEAFTCEFRMIATDGRVVWLRENDTIIRDDEGRPSFSQGVLVDITASKASEAALRDSEDRYRSVVDALEEGVILVGADGAIRASNPSAERILGLTRAELSARSSIDRSWDAVREDGTPFPGPEHPSAAALATGEAQTAVVMGVRRPDGTVAWLSVSSHPLLRADEDRPYAVVTSFMDITERRRADGALREERDRAQRYLDVAGAIMLVLDHDERISLINRRGCEVLGYEESELLGANWFDVAIPELDREPTRTTFKQLMAGEIEEAEFHENPVLTKDGRQRVVAWHNTVLHDADGAIVAALSSGEDVTERRAAEAQIAHLAYHDRLTGLPNRALLEEHLELALARARRAQRAVALLYLDLDDFKLVNDSLGHSVGDELLCLIAARLATVVRETDLLARQGGDEFLLLLSDIEGNPQRSAERVAGQISDALQGPFELAGAEFHIGASIGISLYPRDAADSDALMKHADAAMYQAKGSGRSSFSVYSTAGLNPLEQLSMTSRLRKALERDEFVLHYQPIHSLTDGGVIGVEALARWEDPERGLVMPLEFIPIAEHTGLIEAIGGWVVDALCAQLRIWQDLGLTPRVSFNLSPRELRQADFAFALGERISRAGVEPSAFTVEITESTAMRDRETVEPIMRELHDLGVRLAIDDFGAGHSSLGRLRELPVDELKIDRSFLRDVPASDEAASIVTAIVQLAAALGMSAVAEGVENQDQLDFLAARGCPLAQGFHLGYPLPADEATALLLRALAPRTAA